MSKRIGLFCLALCLALFCGCAKEEDDKICDPAKTAAAEQQEEHIETPANTQQTLDPPADSPAADPETTKATVSGEGFLTEVENQVMNLINKERLSLGLSELEYDPMLHNSARIRSKELCQNMQDQKLSHTRPDGSEWTTVLTQDIPVQGLIAAGEILAREKTTDGSGSLQEPIPAKDWFLLWKASEPHYDTITWAEAETMGVGIYYEIRNGEYYTNATVHFGIYADENS